MKLKEYSYEFEIDENLQLASVDGMKMATKPTDSSYNELKNEMEEMKKEYNTQITDLKTEIKNLQAMSKMTGVKEETYVGGTCTRNGALKGTSMDGYLNERSGDMNNYFSEVDADGYTVLKSGWYFVQMRVESHHGVTQLKLIKNGAFEIWTVCYCDSGSYEIAENSFPIFLTEGDKVYFNLDSSAGSVGQKIWKGLISPMF